MKRALSLLITLAMVLTMMPMTAFATFETGDKPSVNSLSRCGSHTCTIHYLDADHNNEEMLTKTITTQNMFKTFNNFESEILDGIVAGYSVDGNETKEWFDDDCYRTIFSIIRDEWQDPVCWYEDGYVFLKRDEKTGQFYIRTDGTIPDESEGYPVSEYLPNWPGIIVPNALKEEKTVIGDGGNYDNIKANILNEPSPEQIKEQIPTFDSTNQEVLWYVIKYHGDAWHIDGVIREKSQHTVSFYEDDGETLIEAAQTIYDGSPANKPADLEDYEDGSHNYTFAGWVPLGEDYTIDNLEAVTQDMSFKAKFTKIQLIKVTYYVNGEPYEAPEYYDLEERMQIRDKIVQSGYRFIGWDFSEIFCSEDGCYVMNEDENYEVSITGTLTEDQVTFNYAATEGGSVSPTREAIGAVTGVAEGSTATAEEGYEFDGWYNEADEFVSEELHFVPQMIDGIYVGDTYTARFNKLIKVTYFVNAEPYEDPEYYDWDDPITIKSNPTKSGYTFSGWNLSELDFMDGQYFPKNEDEDYKVEIHGQLIENQETFNYEATDGGSVSIPIETIGAVTGTAEGSTATAEEGYEFDYWFNEEDGFVSDELHFVPEPIDGIYVGRTYTAYFNQLVKVTYYVDGEQSGEPEYHHCEQPITIRENPTKSRYRFSGWDLSQLEVDNGVYYIMDAGEDYEVRINGTFKKKHRKTDPVIIEEEDVILAGTPELNKVDHFNYVAGYPKGDVRPENQITREEVAMIFYRLLTDTSREMFFTSEEDFSDVGSTRWSVNAIATLANGSIVSGYKDGTFGAGHSITRGEFATIASQFDSLEEVDTNLFTDIDNHWAKKYINSAATKGWIKGYKDNTFRPDQFITRAEAMTLINKVLERRVNAEGLVDGYKAFPDNKAGAWYYYEVIEATNNHNYADRETMADMETWTEVLEDKTWK